MKKCFFDCKYAGAASLTAAGMILVSVFPAFSDVIKLKTGETVQCTFLGGDTRTIRVEVGGAIRSYAIQQVATLSFVDSGATPAEATEAQRSIPTNISIFVRVTEAVDSSSNKAGQTFSAVMDAPITVNGVQLVPKGAPAQVRIVNSASSGTASMTVQMASITVNGKQVTVNSSEVVSTQSPPQPNQDVNKVANGTSAISGIASALGGGRGAMIGSTGARAISAGNQLAVRGARVQIPVDTQLTFRTQGVTIL